MTPLAPLITSFFCEHLPIERGQSPHTITSYADAFRLLLTFAGTRLKTRPASLHLEHLDATLVLAFLSHIEGERKNGPTTRNVRLAAIKAFMRYVELRVPSALSQVAQIRAIPFKRHDHALIQHFTLTEIRAILDAPRLDTRLGIRDRAMMHLCFAAGLRVSELVGLPLEGLSLQPTPTIRVRGKGRKDRCLPLWKETASDLRGWLAVRGKVAAPELFVNAAGAPMTRAGFEYVLDKHFAAAREICSTLKGRKISPHQLRHSCAVMMLQATREVRKVALWLGHADVSTTEAYLRVDPSEKLEAIEAAVPLALRRGRFKAPDDLIESLMRPE